MSNSYTVTSPGYGGGYSNRAYNGHEMAEYNHGNNGRNGGKNGTGNQVSATSYTSSNSGFAPHHQRSGSVSVNGSLKASNGVSPAAQQQQAAVAHAEEEEDEFDRGHWGSKAEFILSCIGFSVIGFRIFLRHLFSVYLFGRKQ
ncbi:unnamed protein product [Sphagnum tenellum]